MNATLFFSRIGAWCSGLLRTLREARRARRDLHELAQMGPHELRDLGISHPAAAAAARPGSCRA